jgi:glycosyltransferase involved in cell wall biosynthesis
MICINGKFLTQQLTGVQRFALQITRSLIHGRDDIKILVPKNSSIKIQNKEIQQRIVPVGRGNPFLWEQIALPYYLQSNGSPLLLNFTGLGPVIYKNKITTIHDLSFWEHPDWFSKKYEFIYRLLTPISSKNSLKLLTVSHYSKKIIESKLHINEENIEVIYNAVDKCTCDPNLAKRRKYILAVGSIDPRKNLDRLIKAFILWNRKDYKLVIIGGQQKSFSNLNLPENENIIYTGYVSDAQLHQYYTESSVFVYPSLYEGFGIPPLEAMVHGTPVIASNKTSLPEACGNAAFYIDPNSIDNIVDALEKVTTDTDLYQELITKGYENIKRFSWAESAKKVNDIISKI